MARHIKRPAGCFRRCSGGIWTGITVTDPPDNRSIYVRRQGDKNTYFPTSRLYDFSPIPLSGLRERSHWLPDGRAGRPYRPPAYVHYYGTGARPARAPCATRLSQQTAHPMTGMRGIVVFFHVIECFKLWEKGVIGVMIGRGECSLIR